MLTETKPTRLLAACVEDKLCTRKVTPSISLYEPNDSPDSSKTDLVSLSWLQKGNLLKIPPIDNDDYFPQMYLPPTYRDRPIKNEPDSLVEPPVNEEDIRENEGQPINSPVSPKSPTNLSKPNYSYTHLIFMAIESTPNKYMTVNQIYNWCELNFPFYKHAGTGWKNSLRHNLSINKSFKRLPRDNRGSGRGAYWAVEPRERQNLIDGLNRNPWNVTAIAFSGSPKINESGHMNVTATLNSLGCNRFAKFNQASLSLPRGTFVKSLITDDYGQSKTITHQLVNNMLLIKGTNSVSLLPRSPMKSFDSLLEYQNTEFAENARPSSSPSLGNSINSTGSSSLVSVPDTYLSSYCFGNVNEVNVNRKYLSDDSTFLLNAFNNFPSNWNEDDDLSYSQAVSLMLENHEEQKIKKKPNVNENHHQNQDSEHMSSSRLLQTVAKLTTTDSSMDKILQNSVSTKKRRKANLRPTKEADEKNDITSSKCPECKENSRITTEQSTELSTNQCESCSQLRQKSESNNSPITTTTPAPPIGSSSCHLRYYTEAEWFSIYPHLRAQFMGYNDKNYLTSVYSGRTYFNDDSDNVLNSLDADQETGPASFPTMMLATLVANNNNNKIDVDFIDDVEEDHEGELDGIAALDKTPKTRQFTNDNRDIYITPACNLDHEYAHCQAQLRTPKDQASISRYNNKVKAYLELVKSTLSSTPNALITPFEMFLNDSPPGIGGTKDPESQSGKQTRRQKQALKMEPPLEIVTGGQSQDPSTTAKTAGNKRSRTSQSKIKGPTNDSVVERRASTRRIRAPKRPYDEIGYSDVDFSSSDGEGEETLRRSRGKLVVAPRQISSSGSVSKCSDELEEDDKDSQLLQNSSMDSLSDFSLNGKRQRKANTTEVVATTNGDDESKSLDEDWVDEIEDQYSMYCEQKSRYYQNKKEQSAGLLSRFSESEDEFNDENDDDKANADGLESDEAEYFSMTKRLTFEDLASTLRKMKPTTNFSQLKNVFLRQSRQMTSRLKNRAGQNINNNSSSSHDTSTETIRMD